jgi:hypothetical protein
LKINELGISRYGKDNGRLNVRNTNRGTAGDSYSIVKKKNPVF